MELYSDIFGLRLPARFLSKGDCPAISSAQKEKMI